MLCLKQFTLVAILKLLGSLFQAQGPTYGKIYITISTYKKVISIICYNNMWLLHYS